MKKRPRPLKGGGTLMRGEDGAMYFIPQEELAAFRMSRQQQQRVARAVFKTTEDTHLVSALPARLARRVGLLAGDNDPTVVVANIGAFRRKL